MLFNNLNVICFIIYRYHIIETTWLSDKAPSEISMFKHQPHLINNIPDQELAKRLRTVLFENPFAGIEKERKR